MALSQGRLGPPRRRAGDPARDAGVTAGRPQAGTPVRRPVGERGAVTAELAVGSVGVVVALAAVLSVGAAAAAQLSVQAAAGAGARAAARGDDEAAVRAAALARSGPEGRVTAEPAGSLVTVRVERPVRLVLPGAPVLNAAATATAAVEVPLEAPAGWGARP